jgi:hypothetical protein
MRSKGLISLVLGLLCSGVAIAQSADTVNAVRRAVPYSTLASQVPGLTYAEYEEALRATAREIERQAPKIPSYSAPSYPMPSYSYTAPSFIPYTPPSYTPRRLSTRPAYVYSSPPRVTPYSASGTSQKIGNFTYGNTQDSNGNTYNTTEQTIGKFKYSNTQGSNGYQANATQQRIGTFDYMNGNSTEGSFSGTRQNIGKFGFTNIQTEAGSWNGTSQRIGNFTFETLHGPNGETVTNTIIRFGGDEDDD